MVYVIPTTIVGQIITRTDGRNGSQQLSPRSTTQEREDASSRLSDWLQAICAPISVQFAAKTFTFARSFL